MQTYYGQPFRPFGLGMTRAVRAILVITCAVYFVQLVIDARTGGIFTLLFGLSWPALRDGYIWQPVTYLFLHDGGRLWHIILNMFVLVMFGRQMETVLGTRRFLMLYMGAGVVAGIGWLLISGSGRLCVGASGAVFGIMGAFAAMFPDRVITLLLFFVIPVSMTARTMVIILAAVSLFSLMVGGGNVAHTAHLAGGVVGYLYGLRAAGRGIPAGRQWGLRNGLASLMNRRRYGRPPADEGPPSQAEVDRVLDKISEEGFHRLTPHERDVLERASRRKG